MEFKELLALLKVEYCQKNYPNYPKKYLKPTIYKNSSNGLTDAICDFFKYIGGEAKRVNTMGVPRKVHGRFIWTKSNKAAGMADIVAIFKGLTIFIEVKFGRDRMRPAQIEFARRVTENGGNYLIAKDFDQFYLEITELFKRNGIGLIS